MVQELKGPYGSFRWKEKVNVPKINHRNYGNPWETFQKLMKLKSAIIREAIMGIHFADFFFFSFQQEVAS